MPDQTIIPSSGKLLPNCFVCVHCSHRHEWTDNPICFKNTNYCAMTGNSETAPPIKDSYTKKDCCLYDIHKVAVYDLDFHSCSSSAEILALFQKKYDSDKAEEQY